ncbi:class GN sortase [Gilvimarinus agarilyticus]|uniref:class GN sortase n=1 Tax=Gilvimarinus agarilyticus TaxID=679259 RepID=UPI00069838F8|nr:class GN sortase [Gilvimarinus agarilyticus]
MYEPRNSSVKPLPLWHRGRLVISGLLLVVLIWQWGSAFAIEAKAQLAQVLIERAWQQKLDAPELDVAPWPWADTQPVGRLQWVDAAGRVRKDLYVLGGGHGEALAFGPGLMQVGAGSGSSARVIGGHRDTHFAFLQQLQGGEVLRWQASDGQWRRYVISQRSIADAEQGDLWINPDADSLWLVTCYPFDAVRAGGPLRYVVRADSVSLDASYAHNRRFTL